MSASPTPVLDPAGPADASAPITHSYRPDLDGLRSIAVYLVLLFHTGLGWAKGGFIGVDLFFVLSGFLVTSVLLSEIERDGRFRLGRFYARRVRRLLPAAVVTIVATCLTFTVLWSVVRRLDVIGDAQASLLYYANWHFIAESGDYFAADVEASPFLHFWSLSIEEQFYVFFPILLLALSKVGRRAHARRTHRGPAGVPGHAALLGAGRHQPRLLRHRRPGLPALRRRAADRRPAHLDPPAAARSPRPPRRARRPGRAAAARQRAGRDQRRPCAGWAPPSCR